MRHVPGAPVEPEVEGPTFPFMFLGGPLDHATRRLPVTGAFNVPPEVITHAEPVKLVQRQTMTPAELVDMPRLRYVRHRVEVPGRSMSWFVFVLDGHTPPRHHLLDANPHPAG